MSSAAGARRRAACFGSAFLQRTRAAYKGGLCYTDFWAAYAEVLPQEQHRATGKGAGQTNHVERFNNVLRQRLGRLVRRTLSFSKSDVMHEACLLLFLHEYSCTSTTSRPGISPGGSDFIEPIPAWFVLVCLPCGVQQVPSLLISMSHINCSRYSAAFATLCLFLCPVER